MRPDDSNLLAALYEGVFEQPLWSTFLDRLRQRARADYAALLFRPLGANRPVELFSGRRPDPLLVQRFGARSALDPLPNRAMRDGRVYDIQELIDFDDPVQRIFHDELLKPWGMARMQSMRVAEPGGLDAWLGCAGGQQMGSSVSTLMAGLAPHLRIALRTFAALERERFRSAMDSEAFRRLDYGWLTLDAGCRIVDMTSHMEQFFQRSAVLRRGRYDRLTPASPAIDRELTGLVKAFATDPEARPHAINLSRDPLIDMLVGPVQHSSLSAASPAVAIAYVSGDRWSQADRCDQLVDLFGLLPSEARFAWAISQGQSIADAANSLNLTIETARNYSKRIYAKTGARGQAELVRIILTSMLALA